MNLFVGVLPLIGPKLHVKIRAVLNLAMRNIFLDIYIQSALHAIRKLFSLIGSAKSYNYKYKMSETIDKKSLPRMCLMAYVESTITYDPGLTLKRGK